MYKRNIMKILFAVSCAMTAQQSNAEENWGYQGEKAAKHWADLDPAFTTCKTGVNQSPIDIRNSKAINANLTPINIQYHQNSKSIENKGTTVQVNFESGSQITAEGKTFQLLQVHFHHPSENYIDGQEYPLSGHFVHQNENGELAVLNVMFEEGPENPALAKIWKKIPKKNHKVDFTNVFSGTELLPKTKMYYRFNGSLTTPPCSEGVRWYVLKTPVVASKAQIDQFEKAIGVNHRPLQLVNARTILK